MFWLACLVAAVVLGVCAGAAVGKSTDSGSAGIGAGIVVVIVLCVLVSLPFGIRIINPGEAGVQMAFGSFTGDPLPNGMHIVAPWIQVTKYPTKVREYTMDHTSGEGQKQGDDSIAVLCKDRLQMQIDCTVFYTPKVEKLNWLHANMGQHYMEIYLRPLIRKIIPEVFGQFDAMAVSTSGREEACKLAEKMLTPEFDKMGITLTEVNLRHIQPPEQVLNAISAKLAAVETAKQAEFEAQGMVAKAKGEAEANKLRQVSITPMLIQWEQIQANKTMAGSKNSKIIIIPSGSSPNLIVQP